MDMTDYTKSVKEMTDVELEDELRTLREERFRPATAEKTVKKRVRVKKEVKADLADLSVEELQAQLELIQKKKEGDSGEAS